MAVEIPLVYLIDDRDQQAEAGALESLGVMADWIYPTLVTRRHLAQATLLAVDQYFDLYDPNISDEDYRLPADLPVASVPEDGLALSAVFRASSKNLARPTPLGIALRSGELDKLTSGLPQGIRQPVVAAQHDLEWVVGKKSEDGEPLKQLASLAKALHDYPRDWPNGRVRDSGAAWIGIPDQPWGKLARRQLEQCRPPVEVTPSSAHGLSWMRWLAHRILPFPSFLLSEARVAVMLGVTPGSLQAVTTDPDSSLARYLNLARYAGPLADLQSPRYWRAAIHDLAARTAGQLDADDSLLVGYRLAETDSTLVPLEMDDPVLCIDREYREKDLVVERIDAERLVPDGWPAYADHAWASHDSVAKEKMEDLLAPRAL